MTAPFVGTISFSGLEVDLGQILGLAWLVAILPLAVLLLRPGLHLSTDTVRVLLGVGAGLSLLALGGYWVHLQDSFADVDSTYVLARQGAGLYVCTAGAAALLFGAIHHDS